jgi:hypothetical protein
MLFSLLTVIGGVTEMNKLTLLVLLMLLAPCGTSHADVIILNDGSVFEGEVVEKDEIGTVFSVAGGTFGMLGSKIVSIEDRKPTADEEPRLIRFKTERYDVTMESLSVTPFEEDLIRLYFGCLAQDQSDEACRKALAEKFNMPPIIVQEILGSKMWRLGP